MLCEICQSILPALLGVDAEDTCIQSHCPDQSDDHDPLWQLLRKRPIKDMVQIPQTAQTVKYRQEECYMCSKLRTPIEAQDIHIFRLGSGDPEETAGQTVHLSFYTPTVHEGNNNVADAIFELRQRDQVAYSAARRARLSASTGSKESLDLAAYWFNTCLQEHKACAAKRTVKTRWFPTRLLDISSEKPRLIKTSKEKPTSPYATMSHCWGDETFLVLTAENMSEFEDGISLSKLPLTFRDAIVCARRLDIHYLWIDCYCIVQSSSDTSHVREKLLEISQMKQVYANSILNISAANGSTPAHGCFGTRSHPKDEPECVYDGEKMYHVYRHNDQAEDRDIITTQRIFQRAWVLQERLLCPRMLHFADEQMVFECSEFNAASDKYPQGDSGPPTKFRFTVQEDELASEDRALGLWYHMVDFYSSMQLSHPKEDKFSAIGALAQLIAEATEAQYIAGLFGPRLLLQLCWHASWEQSLMRLSSEWRAPSWSWAALDGQVFQSHGPSPVRHHCTYTEMACIKDTHIELSDANNPYGPLKSAFLVMMARLIPVELARPIYLVENMIVDNVTPRDDIQVQYWYDEKIYFRRIVVDDIFEFEQLDSGLHILLLFMEFHGKQMTVEEALASPSRVLDQGEVCGLLVQKMSSGEYVRKGTIAHRLYSNDHANDDKMLSKWGLTEQETMVLL